MIAVSVKVKGAKALAERLDRLQPAKNAELLRVPLRSSAELVRTISQERYLSGPRPRRLDTVTGELRGSIEVDASDVDRGIARTGTAVLWAPVHEWGKYRRPFLEPALDEAMPRIQRLFEDALAAEVNR